MKSIWVFCSLLQIVILPIVSHAATSPPPDLPVDGSEMGPRFQHFAELKQAEIRDIASEKGIEVPTQVGQFFALIQSNEWSSAQSLNATFKEAAFEEAGIVASALSVGMQDVVEVLSLLDAWGEPLATLYMDEALRAVPDGSVIFAGTREGRFFLTYAAELRRTGHFTVVNQNALCDMTYAEYLRSSVGNALSMFSPRDATAAFKEYVEDVKAGRRGKKGGVTVEAGRVSIKGVHAVMELNGILARRLVDLNKDKHSIFIEESYAIDWMYEYLTPHGLIMRLNDRPVAGPLPPDAVRADQEYWRDLEARLKSIPGFKETQAARHAFAKRRSAIAGLYAHHDMNEHAESAFRQALRLCPTLPDANFGLADLLKRNGEDVRADAILATYKQKGPPEEQLTRIEECLEELRQSRSNEEGEDAAPASSGHAAVSQGHAPSAREDISKESKTSAPSTPPAKKPGSAKPLKGTSGSVGGERLGMRIKQFQDAEIADLTLYAATDEQLPAISALTTLKMLFLDECRALTHISPLRKLINLEVLQVEDCDGIQDYSPLLELPKLTKFAVINSSDPSILRRLSGLKLRWLAVQSWQKEPDLSDLAGLPLLEELTIWRCPGDFSLSGLHELKQLKKIKIQRCRDLSPSKIGLLRKSLPDCEVVYQP